MANVSIRVRICSPEDLFSRIPSAEVFGRRFIPVDNAAIDASEPGGTDADVVIIDTRFRQDLNDLGDFRQTIDVPVLFVVQDIGEISTLFRRMVPGDDVCMAADFVFTSAFRLVRLFGDGSGKTPIDIYKKMLTTDPLTGLENRRSLDETLAQWTVGVSPTNPLSAILMDLDHFKRVNDNYGHHTGDRILVEVANLLKPHISDEIRASRFGGEEMLVLMKADNSRACHFAEFLRQEVEANILLPEFADGQPGPPLTASFGVATVRDATEVSKKLVHRADELMYRAKSEGRNRVEGLEPDDTEDAGLMDDDAVLRDFETRLKVTTDRLVSYLTDRGRKLVGYYRNEADRDGMTGLYRKEYFEKRLAREFDNSKKDGHSLTLLFLDIDDFGNVNRTYGFPTGDSTLKKVSGVMLESVRSVDWTARYGGEELCIIMPSTRIDESRQVAERLRAEIEALEITAYDGREFGVTVSIGLAEITEDDAAPVDLIQRAGDKTREAKKAGKNTIRF